MPVNAVQVRAANAADLPRLLELLWQLSEQSEYPEASARPVAAEQEQALRFIERDPRAQLFVAELAGRVVGTLTLYVLPNLSHGGSPFAIVENVVVDGALRGTGCGRLLMEHAQQLARAAGCYKVSLTSNRKRDDAHRFYERIGYNRSHVGFTRYSAASDVEANDG